MLTPKDVGSNALTTKRVHLRELLLIKLTSHTFYMIYSQDMNIKQNTNLKTINM